MKLISFYFKLVFTLLVISYCVAKYIIKRKPKIPDPMEWTISQVPDLAYDVYPGIELASLDQKYNELISGEDIAQIETVVGKVLPMNAALGAKVMSGLSSDASKRSDR
jgi:hypothetical protein